MQWSKPKWFSYKIKSKHPKCDFYKPKVQYLGHIISETGISLDPEKIKAIKYWATPTSVTDIRPFFGLAGYYQKFIENFSRIAWPMTALQKKSSKFLWTTKSKESFQKLKKLLMTPPVLRVVDLDGDFIVCMDASKEGLGGFLLQNDHAICYES